jgi:predicted MPP superfamily phosphohydrolase
MMGRRAHATPISRRRFLGGIGALTALSIYSSAVEPQWLDVTLKRIDLERLPPGSSIRAVHLADLHVADQSSLLLVGKAILEAMTFPPHFACITGDFVNRGIFKMKRQYSDELWVLAAAVPTYASLGNHDGGRWCSRFGGTPTISEARALLAESGIVLLHNNAARVKVGESAIKLVGVSDLWSERMDLASLEPHLQNTDPDPIVVLAHNPD